MPHRCHHGTRRAVCPWRACVPGGQTGHDAHPAPVTRCQVQTRPRDPREQAHSAAGHDSVVPIRRGSVGAVREGGLHPREREVQGIVCQQQASVSPAVTPHAAPPRWPSATPLGAARLRTRAPPAALDPRCCPASRGGGSGLPPYASPRSRHGQTDQRAWMPQNPLGKWEKRSLNLQALA